MGYVISAAKDQRSVNLTDSEWRALIYLASQHGFSAPHLRLEEGEEALAMEQADAEGLRSVLGKVLEARNTEAIKTPDGELAYDTIQRVRHVLLSEGVRARPARLRESPANGPVGQVHRTYAPECAAKRSRKSLGGISGARIASIPRRNRLGLARL